MANIYVRSTDGNNVDSGATWALAKATISGADATPDAAGDTIWLSQNHAESTAGNVSISLAGTRASPSRVLCGNDAAEPPTALAATATITTTASGYFVGNGNFYAYGITIQAGDSANTSSVNLATNGGEYQVWDTSKFRVVANSSGNAINVGNGGSFVQGAKVIWNNCSVRFANSGNRISVTNADLRWNGGSVESGGTSPTSLFTATSNQRSAQVIVSGVDLSNLSSTAKLVETGSGQSYSFVFRDCKLPASWTGSLCSSAASVGSRFEMYNCDSSGTNYRLWIEDYAGSIKHETTIVRTSGASDGTTSLAWKMASSADAEFPTIVLYSPDIQLWNDTTAASKTLTVEIVHDSVTALNDDEVWLEVMYLGSSASPLGTWITDAKADVLATAAAQTGSGVTWTTTGLTNPNKQALSVTFTPNMKGPYVCRVALAKASKTIYVDPLVTVA